jgi:hypothetical protein
MDPDRDSDPDLDASADLSIFVSDLQDINKKYLFVHYFLEVHFSKIKKS